MVVTVEGLYPSSVVPECGLPVDVLYASFTNTQEFSSASEA